MTDPIVWLVIVLILLLAIGLAWTVHRVVSGLLEGGHQFLRDLKELRGFVELRDDSRQLRGAVVIRSQRSADSETDSIDPDEAGSDMLAARLDR